MNAQAIKYRGIKQIITGLPASDGDGVQLTRVIGSAELNRLDPFLLLDAFGSDRPQDYIGGFPPHPHRGFETVTYMLAGSMRHEDSAGNAGVIESGGVQWMTAGRGIIHSEMPEQEQGLLAGFQLWVNLPAADKMSEPKYQERSKDEIAQEVHADGTRIKVIAGQTEQGTLGVIDNSFVEPNYFDIEFTEESQFEQTIDPRHNGFIYIIEGEVSVDDHGGSQAVLSRGQLGVLDEGAHIKLSSRLAGSRLLLISGKPLNEPVERAGPFVMNTKQEILQAFADYQQGKLTG